MKTLKNKLHKLNSMPQIMFVSALILLAFFSLLTQYGSINFTVKMANIILIPIFLLYSMIKGAKFSLLHKLIVLLFFLSSFFAAFNDGFMCNRLYAISLLLGMIGLVSIAIKNFKTFNYRSVMGFCLILVFLVNIGFVVVLFNALKGNMIDQFEIVFFVVKFCVLLILGFVSFATFIEEGKKESILFLFVAFSFMFSEVMYYINTYYLPEFSFNLMAKVLNGIGLYFMFQYIIEVKKDKKSSNKELVFVS